MLKKSIFFFYFLLIFSSSYSQSRIIEIRGKNYGRNLIVSNPFAATGVGFSIQEIRVNDSVPYIEINGSVFEIDLSECGVKLFDSVTVRITHKLNSIPKIYNPESITDPDLESFPSIDNSSSKSYYLKDKSLCIIKGKIIAEHPVKVATGFRGEKIFENYNLNLVNVSRHTGISDAYLSTDQKGNYIVLAEFGDLYELNIEDNQSRMRKKVLLDLRGVPEDKKKGQLIYVNFILPDYGDSRLEKINTDFPANKLYFDPVVQTLKWDEDFSNAIKKVSEILGTQIDQETSLKKVELDRQLKLLEIEKNKTDLIAKNLEINGQKSEIEKQLLDKRIKENEIQAKSLLLKEDQNQKNNLYLIIAGTILITLGSLFAFFRQRKLKQQVNSQKNEAEFQKQLVETKHKEITDSMEYAKRIQQSLMPTEKYIDKNLNRLKDKK